MGFGAPGGRNHPEAILLYCLKQARDQSASTVRGCSTRTVPVRRCHPCCLVGSERGHSFPAPPAGPSPVLMFLVLRKAERKYNYKYEMLKLSLSRGVCTLTLVSFGRPVQYWGYTRSVAWHAFLMAAGDGDESLCVPLSCDNVRAGGSGGMQRLAEQQRSTDEGLCNLRCGEAEGEGL